MDTKGESSSDALLSLETILDLRHTDWVSAFERLTQPDEQHDNHRTPSKELKAIHT